MLRRRRARPRSSLDTGFDVSGDGRAKATFGTSRAFLTWLLRLLPLTALLVPFALILYVIVLAPAAPPPPAAALGSLLSDLQSVLHLENVTHWLAPGAELLPSSPTRARFTEHHRSLTVGVEHGRSMDVLVALSEARAPLATVETHAGLRVFRRPRAPDAPAHVQDHREPFVDLHPYRREGALLVNACCKCARATVSACTKKLCRCQACALHEEAVFPLVPLRVAGVARALPAPRAVASVMLDRDADDLPDDLARRVGE